MDYGFYVQYETSERLKIIALFSSPQDPAVYPNIEPLDPSVAAYSAYYATLPDDIKGILPEPQ